MIRITCVLLSLIVIACASQAAAGGFENYPGARKLAGRLAEKGIPAATTRRLLAAAEKSESVLDRIRSPAETRLNWASYRDIFVKPKRAKQGAAYIRRHHSVFTRVSERYGVPPQVIAAIIGVETFYGRYTGDDRVLDSLATLAFAYPPRSDFFRGELAAFIRLCVDNNLACTELKGSYAGALGLPQFIPSSYIAYAVDGNDDGERDLWHQPADVIASIANYLARNGWREGEAVATPVRVVNDSPAANTASSRPDSTSNTWRYLGQRGARAADPPPQNAKVALIRLEGEHGHEYWAVRHNFFVITDYNHSDLYAMAVHQLARAIKQRLE